MALPPFYGDMQKYMVSSEEGKWYIYGPQRVEIEKKEEPTWEGKEV